MGSSEQGHSDDALVESARQGDTAAFDVLLRRHEGRVLRVLRLLGVPLSDREDVAQDVFVRVFRHLGGFRAGNSFSGWLYRITVNASHDHRVRNRRRRLDEVAWEERLDTRADDSPDAGELLTRIDHRRRLEGALAALSERERAVFVLCELEGLESGATARALGISAITVRRHLSLARRRLRRTLLAEPDKKNSPSLNASGSSPVDN